MLHFGFEQSPAQMNAAGRAMPVNAIVYIRRFTEDRPIDVSLSVFGPDHMAVSRRRARNYFANRPLARRPQSGCGLPTRIRD